MRATNILIVAVASLSLAACSSVRTVNGVDIESRSKLCHGPVESCVLLGLAVVAAAGIGVAVVSGLTKDRKEPRFFLPAHDSHDVHGCYEHRCVCSDGVCSDGVCSGGI